jgi:hypothetical protein
MKYNKVLTVAILSLIVAETHGATASLRTGVLIGTGEVSESAMLGGEIEMRKGPWGLGLEGYVLKAFNQHDESVRNKSFTLTADSMIYLNGVYHFPLVKEEIDTYVFGGVGAVQADIYRHGYYERINDVLYNRPSAQKDTIVPSVQVGVGARIALTPTLSAEASASLNRSGEMRFEGRDDLVLKSARFNLGLNWKL